MTREQNEAEIAKLKTMNDHLLKVIKELRLCLFMNSSFETNEGKRQSLKTWVAYADDAIAIVEAQS